VSLRLYNTLTKKEEPFVPSGKVVTMYTCGPTVYGRPHIGNYSSFLLADLLRRWLEAGHGLTVKHVKNITDVGHLLHDADHGDDKIQKEARKQKLHPLEVAKRYTDQYLEDEKALSMLEPIERPRATAYIKEMIVMIEELLANKFAYVTDDGIYFDVTAKNLLTPYGTLSGNTIDKVKSGARIEVDADKKHPADFALWKFCVGENADHILRWPSPQSPVASRQSPEGFPGWHIECSAMSKALLGSQIDIHTGGEDNIFPHHECEIAQSESVSQKSPFVKLWLHRRRIDLGEAKMSKTLGNVLTLPDITSKGFSPMDLRYYLLSVHYRTNLKFSWKGLEDAAKARRKVVEWMGEQEKEIGESEEIREIGEFDKGFREAMDDDLNTPAALAALFDAMNTTRASLKRAPREFVELVQKTFGCFAPEAMEVSADVQKLLSDRERARGEKNFAESDRLRVEIEKHGFELKDTKEGQKLIHKPKSGEGNRY
jgi:cysteinyl-tRNA synthetase